MVFLTISSLSQLGLHRYSGKYQFVVLEVSIALCCDMCLSGGALIFMCPISPSVIGNQYQTSDWAHQRPQNQPQPWHHQFGDSLQGTTVASYWQACRRFHSTCQHALLNGLCFLLSGNGAHAFWNRGPLRTVESLLLEGQVRTCPPYPTVLAVKSVSVKLYWNEIGYYKWPNRKG